MRLSSKKSQRNLWSLIYLESTSFLNTLISFFRFKRNLLRSAVAFSVVYNIPRYFEMVTKEDSKTKMLYIESTEMRQNPIYISLYVFWSKLILVRKEKWPAINFGAWHQSWTHSSPKERLQSPQLHVTHSTLSGIYIYINLTLLSTGPSGMKEHALGVQNIFCLTSYIKGHRNRLQGSLVNSAWIGPGRPSSLVGRF